jgi:Protein of unknown function (DUF3305)
VTELAPHMRIAVGVVVERRKATSPWAEFVWRPVAVLAGLPETAPWTPLAVEGDITRFYAGAGEIELHRSEAENYRSNLTSSAPSVWVALQASERDPPYEVMALTVDPAEGEALTDSPQAIVDSVAMPQALCDLVAAFIAEYHIERVFEKRKRDRANPDALARASASTKNQS